MKMAKKKKELIAPPKIISVLSTEYEIVAKYNNGLTIWISPSYDQKFHVNFSGIDYDVPLDPKLYGPNQVEIKYKTRD